MRPFFRALTLLLGVAAQPAFAGDLFDGGKLLATGGVSQVEGAGGGGLANWALITGYGTRDGVGANVHYTAVPLPDYTLQTHGRGGRPVRPAGAFLCLAGVRYPGCRRRAGAGPGLHLSSEYLRRQAEADRRCGL